MRVTIHLNTINLKYFGWFCTRSALLRVLKAENSLERVEMLHLNIKDEYISLYTLERCFESWKCL